jgi:sulfate adenylyltransferase subunit 1 (EFTu-like GTPase family)
MVTGASTADLAVVLVDARHGVVEQTRRHAFIASLLRIPHIVVAVNKMDLVDYAEEAFDAVVRDFPALDVRDITFIPLSALKGDNVVDRSAAMPWYTGPALLEHLEGVDIEHDRDEGGLRFPVQYVIRDGASDYRGYAGRVAGGVAHPGDEVVVLPSGVRTTIAAVDTFDGELASAEAGLSVTIRLAGDVDVSRGDMICSPGDAPELTREVHADVAGRALRDQALDDDRARDRRRGRGPPRRRHPPAPRGRRRAGAQRHRPRDAAHVVTRRRGPLPRQPRDRLVHPHRRGDERHGRRGHDHAGFKPPGVASTPCAARRC